ncbi:MAG: HEAT repeat domain-containing protein [Saprospiraceae bacterium]|nr:HEAT repeat domain-containing protein [Saprospiraceae bacterium]
MQIKRPVQTLAPLVVTLTLLVVSCMKFAQKGSVLTIREDSASAMKNAASIREKTTIKTADGLQVSLWAPDSLAPDPIAVSVDDQGRVYLTRTNRQKNSEFDIRGHRDWMTASISLRTVEERRAFLHSTFAPERSKENEWLKDLNFDGSHDWRDLAIEKEEIWRLEDTNHDGMADVSTRILNDFHDEITDIAGGILVREHDVFLAIAPDLWRIEDTNGDGMLDKKTSISHGYGVHIGFSGHNMSGIVEGPDGRIYWNMGDIGASITTVDGRKFENPNSGFIARCNPDGSDFEIFATGLRNTHEFAFDEYGNLISCDNDGDHPGESERLVHIVEGSDAGWRSNWQYGKYTDPANNGYNVWMDEKLYLPRWNGQAAYIIPPIMNYHNGPTGMVYNPGTALGSAWKNKFFVVEFVGNPARSPIWSFGLKPKGASFELDGEQEVLSGILPTGIQFGPDGALYVADWVNGWNTKDYGRVWKLDVTQKTNDLAVIRQETQRLMQLDYPRLSLELLYALLFNDDLRIRKKAQFELVGRREKGLPWLQKAIAQKDNQLARIHGIWGVGQLTRKDKSLATVLKPLLKDTDPEIIVQTLKVLGDAEIMGISDDLISLLNSPVPRIRFYAAEALGQVAERKAFEPLVRMLEVNNDADVYLRHAAVLALSRIGQAESVAALSNHPSKAVRIAAVLVLRRLENEQIARFLNDPDEYIATEAARGINDDLSIPAALPALADMLKESRPHSEAMLRRAINAALRIGGEKQLDMLLVFSKRKDLTPAIKAEALAALGTWANPSVLDRVDGRFRGAQKRDAEVVRALVRPHIAGFLQEADSETLIAVAGMLTHLKMMDFNEQLAKIYHETTDNKVKMAVLPALDQLKYRNIAAIIKNGMEDTDPDVRTVALGLLNDSNVNQDNIQAIVNTIFSKGSTREQQQLLVVLGKLSPAKTTSILSDLTAKMRDRQLSPDLMLELTEAVEANGLESLKAQLAAIQPDNSMIDTYAEALYGGNIEAGRDIFYYNSTAQCMRCHTIGTDGGTVGPQLAHIGSVLNREQILQALVEPGARLAPGYGSVALTLKDGQQVYGILSQETDESLTITTSDAEPLHIAVARIAKRENLPSSMPPMGETLSKREIRDLVAFLVTLEK